MDSPFLNLVTRRRSVRSYSSQAVEFEKLALCLEAARLAPSACNSQPWKFVVIDEPGLRRDIAKATTSPGMKLNSFVIQAPILVVVVSEGGNLTSSLGAVIKRKDLSSIDIGIAAEHFCLAAAELGLGTCIVGWFNERKIKKLIGAPAGKRPVLLISVGYPVNPDARPKKRNSLSEIAVKNAYSGEAIQAKLEDPVL